MSKPKTTIAEQLNVAQLAVNNSAADAEIGALVAGYGYSAGKLGEGKALFDAARAAVSAQEAAAGKQLAATGAWPPPRPRPKTPTNPWRVVPGGRGPTSHPRPGRRADGAQQVAGAVHQNRARGPARKAVTARKAGCARLSLCPAQKKTATPELHGALLFYMHPGIV